MVDKMTSIITEMYSTGTTAKEAREDSQEQSEDNQDIDASKANNPAARLMKVPKASTLYEVFQRETRSWDMHLALNLASEFSNPCTKPVHEGDVCDEGDLEISHLPPQHSPIQLHTYFHELQEAVKTRNDVSENGHQLTPSLFDDLRTHGILAYLVPEEHEEDFHRIHRIQKNVPDRKDPTAGTLALIGYWLQQCWSNHPECPGPNASSNAWPILPKRVIDLTEFIAAPSDPESRIKVIETNLSRGAYVALSYRWPKEFSESPILSCSTLSLFELGIPINFFLPEIQDACMVTMALGIQYLWVDALCIIQGPGGDWHVQAEEMASIYKNAVVTIAAVDGTSLAVAGEAKPFLSNQQDLTTLFSSEKTMTPESTYLWLEKSGNFVFRPFGQLDNRGWGYQEQLLSGRVISLTEKGVFWDCLHHSASSNRPNGILGDFSPGFVHSDNRAFKKFLLKPHALISSGEYYWLFRRAVQNFTKRMLTNECDRFIAFEGITRQMTMLLNDECILGIWRKDALRSLIWFVEPPDSYWRATVGVRGPSWSWIPLTTKVQYRLWHPYERYVNRRDEITSKKAVILDIFARRENPLGFDRFSGRLTIVGAVSEGYLYRSKIFFARRLRDQQKLANLALEHEATFENLWMNQTGSIAGSFYIEDVLLDPQPKYLETPVKSSGFITQADPKRQRVYGQYPVRKVQCLLLLEGGYTDILSAHYCLILQKVVMELAEDGSEYYRRLGLAAFNSRHICMFSGKLCTNQHMDYSDCMGTIQRVHIV